ncbi:transposase [Clostridium sp. DJ247]|uniref:transposase n=1 Tax=Clostridium sp. DJ247 TaxID=2726188 RepID=UPI001A9AE077|nr:transposase [Clostridium sp. DJ247]
MIQIYYLIFFLLVLPVYISNEGKTFIIDGKKLKSINQWFNKENSRLQSIKDLQSIKGTTKKQSELRNNRNNKVNDYINKTCRYIMKPPLLKWGRVHIR